LQSNLDEESLYEDSHLIKCQHTFTRIGKERGWPPATRAQFDALRSPRGALLIGDAETIAQKIPYVNEVLGGLARITFQMGVSALPHEKMLRAIEVLGARVAPMVRNEPPPLVPCEQQLRERSLTLPRKTGRYPPKQSRTTSQNRGVQRLTIQSNTIAPYCCQPPPRAW
jgi:hypothetical protein